MSLPMPGPKRDTDWLARLMTAGLATRIHSLVPHCLVHLHLKIADDAFTFDNAFAFENADSTFTFDNALA